jgi:hypothetical protein
VTDDFTLDDYDRILKQHKRWWPSDVWNWPGIDPFHGYAGYSAVPRVRRIIAALSPQERTEPRKLGHSRLVEVAAAAGVAEWEVNQMIVEFQELRAVIRQVAALNWWERLKLILGLRTLST